MPAGRARQSGTCHGVVAERAAASADGTARQGAGPQSVWDVRLRLDENFRRVEALLREMEVAADPKLRLAAAAELRQHIALAEKTLEAAARAEAVRAFEEIVLDALETASAVVRRKVMDALNARAGIEREGGADESAGSDGRPERDAPVVLRSDGAAVRQ